MKLLRIIILNTLLLSFNHAVFADVKPARIFSNNMVLQRNKKAAVWGTAANKEKVTVSFAGQEKSFITGNDGKWLIYLNPMPENPTGQEMVIKSDKSAKEIKISNILIGEVWLCSGQSNMAWTMASCTGYEEDIKNADLPLIRYNSGRTWLIISPKTARRASATALYFARNIFKDLKIPIGLICRALGGTPIEHWAPREKLLELDFIKKLHDENQNKEKYKQYMEYNKAKRNFRNELRKWQKDLKEGKTDKKSKPVLKLTPPENLIALAIFGNNRLGCLYEGRIKPVIPYSIRGFLWYQGEKDTGLQELTIGYRKTLPLLISNWREVFNEPEAPFLFVQLPNYSHHRWPLMRESMSMVNQAVPNTGMAVTIDIGMKKNIHPYNKSDVGKRLALLALKNVYGKDIVAESPFYKSMRLEENKAIIEFTNTGSGLVMKEGKKTGFEIAGEDKKFYLAEAAVKDNYAIVSSDKVTKPAAVRYAWEADPPAALYNKEGLPASPFRTDEWKINKNGK
ncbi:MAG: sialate O-acetylesterase [Planctomycetota bacterium]